MFLTAYFPVSDFGLISAYQHIDISWHPSSFHFNILKRESVLQVSGRVAREQEMGSVEHKWKRSLYSQLALVICIASNISISHDIQVVFKHQTSSNVSQCYKFLAREQASRKWAVWKWAVWSTNGNDPCIHSCFYSQLVLVLLVFSTCACLYIVVCPLQWLLAPWGCCVWMYPVQCPVSSVPLWPNSSSLNGEASCKVDASFSSEWVSSALFHLGLAFTAPCLQQIRFRYSNKLPKMICCSRLSKSDIGTLKCHCVS